MTQLTNDPQPLSTFLAEPIAVGEPDVAGALAVFPLFGPEASLEYRAFADPSAGATITELESGASVNDLLVHNAGSQPVLLYEGEEVIGAQQNRVLDVSILVAAQSRTKVPVSCVEQGRWDGRRHRERFVPSRQAADPRMRRMKNRQARASAAMGFEARADQGAVWNEVASRGEELSAPSATGAMADIYESRRDELAELTEAIPLHEGQCGSVAVIGGRIQMLDFVGRPDAYAALHDALVQGYALDALAWQRRGELHREPIPLESGDADEATVRGFTLLVSEATPSSVVEGPGLGETARFAFGGVEGSALLATEELVQLTAFPTDGDEDPRPEQRRAARRISRPSRRRG